MCTRATSLGPRVVLSVAYAIKSGDSSQGTVISQGRGRGAAPFVCVWGNVGGSAAGGGGMVGCLVKMRKAK